jgi:phosphate transport system substrate-binding protein
MKKFLLFTLVALISFGFQSGKTTITVKGSDTIVILAQKWAEVYMQKHNDVNIQVTGGGSGVGIAALINGTTDICNSSRPMKEKEKEQLKAKYGNPGIEIKIAKDGITIYVNKSNPLKEISLEQLRDIFTGKITNWKEVGGKDQKITAYGRENSSGTYAYFKEEVLENKDFATAVQTLPGTAAVVSAVQKDKNGIGYGGAAYSKGVKALKVKRDANSPAIEANKSSIMSGKYPISRYLYIYLKEKPVGAQKAYIDWILGAEGQKIVSEVGYFPLK